MDFILPERRDRYRDLLRSPRGRRVVTKALPHFRHFDSRYIVPLSTRQQDAGVIQDVLTSAGVPPTCYVISDSSEIDNITLPLADALNRIVGQLEGTVVLCKAGVLGYYEGEGERFILKRRLRSFLRVSVPPRPVRGRQYGTSISRSPVRMSSSNS